MSESFAVRTNGDVDGGGKIVKATASQKKVVVATGDAWIAPLGSRPSNGGDGGSPKEVSSWQKFTREVIEEDSVVCGNATIQVVPA